MLVVAATPAQQAGCTKQQRAGAHGEDGAGFVRLRPQPAEDLIIGHQCLLSGTAGNVEDIEPGRSRERRIRHEAQAVHVADRVGGLA